MKTAFLLFTFLSITINVTYAQLTYEEAFAECKEKQKEKQKENPNMSFVLPQECLIGAKLPIFEAETLEGKVINSSYFKDKVTIINFWFEGCLPCVAEIPGFNKIVEAFGKDKVNFLAITRDKTEDVQKFLEKRPWKFDHITDANDIIRKKFKSRWGYPTTFVINKKGEIITLFSGGKIDKTATEAIQKKLNPIIKAELEK